MAEIVLMFAVEQLLNKVASIATDGIARAWGMKKDLQKLKELTGRIQTVLQDAEDKQAADKRVQQWLVKLREVLCEAEDVLDEFSYETLRRQKEIQFMAKVRNFASCNNPVLFRLDMAAKIRKINESMVVIENQALSELALKSLIVPNSGTFLNNQPIRVTGSFLDKSEPQTGRKSEVEKIMNMLQESSSRVPTVIAIVGIGGLGKTTLAKLVVEEVRRKQLFDETMWVCVSDTSDTFDHQKVLKGMLETLDEGTGGLININDILEHLQKKLEKKRFLLVLDDVWKEWDSFKHQLQNICTTNGNFVIVTTRNKRLANGMATSAQHMVELEPLLDDECWSIIREKVFGRGGEPEELKTIGFEIATKCGGLPLVAKVLGGTLWSRWTKEEWLSIRDSEVWELANGENKKVMSVLRLSFDRLRPSVKSCFAYCSLYPKDFVYSKQKLIQLWMAEGFLDSTFANEGASVRSMEDVGDEYFHDLLAHSLFQDAEADRWGNIIKCKMHDVLHDLAESVFINRKLRLTDASSCILRASGGQHLSDEELIKDGARNVRSFFSENVVSDVFCNFRSLRSLDISRADITELSAAIGRLTHLRFLDISWKWNARIKELPKAITKLYNLQTLRMFPCRIVSFPNKMINLVSLRYIDFDEHSSSIYKVGCLIGLRTLPFFRVGIEKGFKIEELEGLNDLTGKLKILDLKNVKDGEEAKKVNLKEKKLSELCLEWSEYNSSSSNHNHEDVLEGLLPLPPSMKSLEIWRYGGKHFPNWMSPLEALVELSFWYCLNCEIMPSLGHLPHLKTLTIKRMDNLRCIGHEFYGERNRTVTLFPSLKEFFLRDMRSLEEWAALEGGEQKTVVFPCLEKLEIEECPHLTSIPLIHLSSLLSLSITWCLGMKYLSNETQNLRLLKHLKIASCVNFASLSSLQSLISLKEIRIYYCPRLTSLPKGLTSLQSLLWFKSGNLSSDAFSGLSSLENLEIDEALFLPDLQREFTKYFPNVADLTSLKSLKICDCPELTSLPADLHAATSLRTLHIESCNKLRDLSSVSLSGLVCLEKLNVYSCPKVSSLPQGMKFCNSLHSLNLSYCESLICIDDDIISSLPQLKELRLGPFSKELEEFPGLNSIHHHSNPSLEYLEISGWKKLKSLPNQLQHLTALKHLDISFFSGVKTFPDWLGDFSSLQSLRIEWCSELKNLPTTVKRLSNLIELKIVNCPSLTDPDWTSISHIPNISINERMIQGKVWI